MDLHTIVHMGDPFIGRKARLKIQRGEEIIYEKCQKCGNDIFTFVKKGTLFADIVPVCVKCKTIHEREGRTGESYLAIEFVR